MTLSTYQLRIRVPESLRIRIGQLGSFDFPAGIYVYTGSAKHNPEARIARHLSKNKSLRWHIDYLLAASGVEVNEVLRFGAAECEINRLTAGRIVVARFGASDCRAGCGSHLKYQMVGPAVGQPC
ncbi:GIY-YIG nuclease family protein [Methylocaldum sp.]|uniref:GIY-YIG nuclease family protein n=1 Tax=Methylocaldum sp. TaxID=1969727 RepID=UPI002D24DA62|nr:GIY-YIG nuclease family protein [Methylocaldum sp.]HYE34728.1 GIY-YIG nuclease family protein [Methylocaldum sp.]